MSSEWLMAAALAAPLAGAFAVVLAGRAPNLREAASLAAAAALFACVAALAPAIARGERPAFELFEILPGIGIGFHVEPLGLVFALLAGFLWFVTVLYAIGYMRAHEERDQTRFYAFFAIAIAATIGGAFAANLLTLYIFYEALTLATYPLVTHGGQEKDRAGGRSYLTILFATSLMFLLLAIAWTWSLTGSLAFVEGGLFLDGDSLRPGVTPALLALLYALFLFGTGKAALMPFHRWLPAAMVAPTPVSALLHAVAVVKLGVFTILKVTVYTFGVDALTLSGAADLMQYVAAATLLIAAVLALREDNLKRRLAYSTVSQLAYIVLAAALANQLSLLAGGMHILAHAFAKITLFFCAGVILVSLHKTRISELRGAGRAMPITFGAWLVASLCVIGLPLTGGFWSKWYLAQGALEAGQPLMMAVILLGSLLAMGYLLPPAVRAFYSTGAGETALAGSAAAAGGAAARDAAVAVAGGAEIHHRSDRAAAEAGERAMLGRSVGAAAVGDTTVGDGRAMATAPCAEETVRGRSAAAEAAPEGAAAVPEDARVPARAGDTDDATGADAHAAGGRGAGGAEAPRWSLLALVLTAAASVALFFAARPIFGLLEGFAG